eukprot:m.447280 g.447280  ORF g.447280 m.447280 type:complete len:50 (+) comp19497_c0_seq1:739-888(+)
MFCRPTSRREEQPLTALASSALGYSSTWLRGVLRVKIGPGRFWLLTPRA